MGISSSKSEYIDKVCEQIEREAEIRRERAREETNMIVSMAPQIIRQSTNAFLENSRDDLDRKTILNYQRYLGYNLDPYTLSRNELRYWSNRMSSELELKNHKYSSLIFP